MNYNLLEEKWIPVLWNDGKPGRVNIRTALTKAGRIRQIAASNPMDRVAILRFLLAVLYWCKGNPPEAESTNHSESFPSDWFSKLDENRDCFNLLGEGKRFYQCAVPGEKLSSNYLIHEIPTGTNKWHFRHSTDQEDGLCPACCAMGLLRLPLFATSGGRGKPPGINAKPPLYVVPAGVSLAATLRLSWRPASNLGMPAWEKPDLQLPKTGEVPLLTGLTWLPRRVWLDNPEESESICISCGRKDRIVRLCVFAGIGSTKTDEGGPGRYWRDPHVIYSTSTKGGITSLHASDALGARDAAAGQWAKIISEMLQDKGAINPMRQAKDNSEVGYDSVNAWIFGFSTVKNDKYLEAMECLMPFPYSQHQPAGNLERIERWRKEGWRLEKEKRIGRSEEQCSAIIAAIRPHVESKVSTNAGELLAGGDVAWGQAAAEYRPMMEMIAKSLSPGFTTAAVKRRKQIAGVRPNMRPKTESTKKTARKKGGDK